MKELINEYFRGLVFTLVERKNANYIYAAKVGQLVDGGRYVIVISSREYGQQRLIEQIDWVNVQTRVLKNSYRLPVQKWSYSRKLFDIGVLLVSRENYSTYYDSERKVEIILLNNPNKKSKFQ